MIDFKAALTENTHTDQDDIETTNQTAITPLDAAKNQLMQFRAGVNAMQREATELTVSSEAEEAKCSEMIAQTKSLKKEIEVQQDMLISEPQKFVKSVQQFTLPFRKDLEAIEAQLKRKLGDYGYRKEMERRKAEAAAQAAAAEAQRQIDREAKRAGIEPVQLPAPVIPQEAEPIRTESGSTSYVLQWAYDIIDKSKIPTKYLADDPTNRAAVMESIRAGVRNIDGLRIYEKMVARTRTV